MNNNILDALKLFDHQSAINEDANQMAWYQQISHISRNCYKVKVKVKVKIILLS